jgi:phage shock protein PspC (stress-responsive transcriptional regulator)
MQSINHKTIQKINKKMNKTFNINLGGYPFAIDEDAFNYIQQYLNAIRKHFSTSDGCDEILYDIEVRMAELFQEHLKGRAIISMKEVDEVVTVMGKPEDFGAEPIAEPYQYSGKSKKSTSDLGTGKRLFRDPDDQKLAGVCSGIAAYFGIQDPLWVRLLFVLLMFTGAGVITYIVLWVLVPEASNTGDKLAMRGEPATIENIARVVEEELTQLGDKINEWSKDLGNKKKRDDVNSGFAAKSFLSSSVNAFGIAVSGFIPALRKVFKPIVTFTAIVILSILGISWAASFIGLTVASPLVFAMGPTSSIINILGIGSLFFLVGLPILGLMLSVARAVFGYRIHKNVKTGLWVIWFVSIFTTLFASMSTLREFSSYHEQKINSVHNILADEISIVMPEESLDQAFGVHLGGFFTEKDYQWAMRDVNFSIGKSADGMVHIEKKVTSKGDDQNQAIENTKHVTNDLTVNDNVISMSRYLSFPKDRKYRNQSIHYTIFIPEGKKVRFDDNALSRIRSNEHFKEEYFYTEGIKEWTMTKAGLVSPQYEDLVNHKKTVDIGAFSKVFIDQVNVKITSGSKNSLQILGPKEQVSKVVVKQVGDVLTISLDGNYKAVHYEIEDIVVELAINNNVDFIQLDDVEDATISGINDEVLDIVASGDRYDCGLIFEGIVKSLNVSISGVVDAEFIGNAENMNISLSRSADIMADKLIVKNMEVKSDGSDHSDSQIHVSQTLKMIPAELDIEILGNPKILSKPEGEKL